MDSITHVFLGAAVGQSLAGKKNNHKAALVGALAASAPDFDVFLQHAQDPLSYFEIHRSFTHSFAFIPLGALIILAVMLLCFKTLRPHWKLYFWVCLLAYASHGLMDACTSYGTELLWPFSSARISWDIISIVDPVFTLCLIAGVTVSWWKSVKKPAWVGLAFAMLYLIFCDFQHYRALTETRALMKTRGEPGQMLRVIPDFASIYHWRSLYVYQGKIYHDFIATPLFHKSSSQEGFSLPQFEPQNLPVSLIQNDQLLNAAKVFFWFTQGYASIASVQPFILVDMRYLNLSHNQIKSLWGIALIKQEKDIKIVRLDEVNIQ